MHQLVLDRGLLLTDMEIMYRDERLTLHRVLIDTGSANTIISADLAAFIGIRAEDNDPIYQVYGVGGYEWVYSKKIDSIKVGNQMIHNIEIEIGAMNYGFDLDGILGMNALKRLKAMINIENLSLQYNCS